MKKVLSLVLAFAMILGSFAFAFASDFPDVSDTEYYGEPVNVLSGLGVIGGFPDGTFGPEKEVTRAQMATMIVNALGMTVTGQADTKFSDVPASHWASGFINYAASVGFVAGYPDGTFKPDAQVTYDQALTMIVAALGYKAESLTGTWPGSFVNQARGLGILDICKTTGTANAPRQDIACFLYKALTSPIGYVDKDGAFHQNVGADGKTGTDTMMARLGATLYDPDGDKTANKPGDAFIVTGEESAVISLQNYLGAYVTAYANKDGKIVAMKEIKSEYIEGAYADLDDAYKLNDDSAAALFTNGEYKKDTTKKLSAYEKDDTSLKVAVALDGKKVTKVYSIQEWVGGVTFMFEEDMAKQIESKTPRINSIKFELDDDDAIDTSAFALNGVGSLNDLKEDDVVTVYKKAAGTVARIDVSDETVSGVITKIKDGAYTIGGNEYGLNKTPKTEADELAKMMQAETEATYYLDYAGNIYFADAEATTDNYAVVLDTGAEGGSWKSDKGTKMIKLFLADGTVKEYVAAGEFAKTYSGNETTACKAGDLVMYSLDKKDQVVAIEKAGAAADMTFDKNGVAGGKALKDATVVFNYAGKAGDPDELADKDNYSVLKASDLFDQKDVNVSTMLNSAGTAYAAVLANGFQAADKVYTFFVKDGGATKGGHLYTALYDGEVKEMTVVSGAGTVALFTTAAADRYTLTFDGEDITKVESANTALTMKALTNADERGRVSGNVYTLGKDVYSLDKDLVVYVKDGKTWSAESASYLDKIGEYFSDIILFKDATDDLYDIAVVVVK